MSKTLEALESILFHVEKVEMTKVAKGYETNSKDKFAIVGHMPDKKVILNTCSDTYLLLDNTTVLLPIIDHLEQRFGDRIKIRLVNEDNARFHVDLIPMGKNIEPIVGDLVPCFRYKNSYDGEFPAELSGGTHRFVCANGASIQHGPTALNFKFKHNDRNILEFAGLEEKIETFLNGFENVGKKVEILRRKKIEPGELAKTIEMIAAGSNLYPKKGIATAIDRAHHESFALKEKLNFWLAYNGLNYVLNHDRQTDEQKGMKMEENRRLMIDAKIFEHALELAGK